VFTQAGSAEVNALATILSKVAFERVGIWAFKSETVFPYRGLGCPDLCRTLVARTMIAGLSNKPWRFPTDLAA
jgi:hypothetical protein